MHIYRTYHRRSTVCQSQRGICADQCALLTTATGSFASGGVPYGTTTFTVRPASDVKIGEPAETAFHNLVLRTVLAGRIVSLVYAVDQEVRNGALEPRGKRELDRLLGTCCSKGVHGKFSAVWVARNRSSKAEVVHSAVKE